MNNHSEVGAAAPDVYLKLGQITRQLHDTLTQLGVMPGLQAAADGLPDARTRLAYIARKTGEAANKVLDSVEHAKLEHASIGEAARAMASAIVADPVRAVASGALLDFVGHVEGATRRIDAHLTDIMLAQDHHDLTGQVVSKVVALAGEIEDNLLKLLLQAAPPAQPARAPVHALAGPVTDATGRTDVVIDQGEVDDLLAKLGF
jgi:chemotaxis protein CheZ